MNTHSPVISHEKEILPMPMLGCAQQVAQSTLMERLLREWNLVATQFPSLHPTITADDVSIEVFVGPDNPWNIGPACIIPAEYSTDPEEFAPFILTIGKNPLRLFPVWESEPYAVLAGGTSLRWLCVWEVHHTRYVPGGYDDPGDYEDELLGRYPSFFAVAAGLTRMAMEAQLQGIAEGLAYEDEKELFSVEAGIS